MAYIPDGRVVGLSKIARVVDTFAKRLQVQEKLTAQIANAMNETLAPQGTAVILQCQHFCMCYRGVRKPGSGTTTSRLTGCFLKDEAARMELLTLIRNAALDWRRGELSRLDFGAVAAYSTRMREEHYDWVIIGSGFGGSVSAHRLTQKGYKILVLEKGAALQ